MDHHYTRDEPSAAVKECREFERGERLGSYRLIELIGAGGMGNVYLAEHVRIGRKVAIKTIRCDLIESEEVLQRFLTEAQAANRVSHDHIVEVTDFVEKPENGVYYIVMEHLEGHSLAHLLARHDGVPEGRCASIAMQIVDALEAVHAANVVHRDLKPENVFLVQHGEETDFVKLIDFGISKVVTRLQESLDDDEMAVTLVGQILGAPAYMSPEQAAGLEVDFRSDIYSLGILLYEMVLGSRPFEADDIGDYIVQHLKDRPPRISSAPQLTRELPDGLEELILKCLEKNPEHRPQSMTEVRRALQHILSDSNDHGPRREPRARSRTALYALLAVVAAALVAVIVGFSLVSGEDGHDGSYREADTPSESKTISVHVATIPEGVTIRRSSGEVLGTTPVELNLERKNQKIRIELVKEGYETLTRELSLANNQSLTIHLGAAKQQ